MPKKGLKTPNKRGARGPAREIHSGEAKVDKTIAGRKGKARKGSVKSAEKVPGAVKGY